MRYIVKSEHGWDHAPWQHFSRPVGGTAGQFKHGFQLITDLKTGKQYISHGGPDHPSRDFGSAEASANDTIPAKNYDGPTLLKHSTVERGQAGADDAYAPGGSKYDPSYVDAEKVLDEGIETVLSRAKAADDAINNAKTEYRPLTTSSNSSDQYSSTKVSGEQLQPEDDRPGSDYDPTTGKPFKDPEPNYNPMGPL